MFLTAENEACVEVQLIRAIKICRIAISVRLKAHQCPAHHNIIPLAIETGLRPRRMEVATTSVDGTTSKSNVCGALSGAVTEYECRPGRAIILQLPPLALGKRHNITIAVAPNSGGSLIRQRLITLGGHRSRAEMVWSSELAPPSSLGVPPDGLGIHARRRRRGAVQVAVVAAGMTVVDKTCAWHRAHEPVSTDDM